jgi:hypothetical protein
MIAIVLKTAWILGAAVLLVIGAAQVFANMVATTEDVEQFDPMPWALVGLSIIMLAIAI